MPIRVSDLVTDIRIITRDAPGVRFSDFEILRHIALMANRVQELLARVGAPSYAKIATLTLTNGRAELPADVLSVLSVDDLPPLVDISDDQTPGYRISGEYLLAPGESVTLTYAAGLPAALTLSDTLPYPASIHAPLVDAVSTTLLTESPVDLGPLASRISDAAISWGYSHIPAPRPFR